jgi:hypothetical protein
MSNWIFGSAATDWIFGSTNYVPSAVEGEFAISSYPTLIKRGTAFALSCSGVDAAPTATLNGRAIEVESYDADEIELLVPLEFDGQHGASQTVAITVGDVTKSFTTTFTPPVGWGYVNFVDPTNDPDTAAFYNLQDDNGDPTIVEDGDQGVYQVLSEDEREVAIDPDNTIAINTGGQSIVGVSIRAYLITGDGRGTEGDIEFDSYQGEPPGENNPPELTGTIPNQSIAQGQPLSFPISSYFSDPDGDALTFSKAAGNSAFSVSSAGVVTGSTSTAGTYSITVMVSDGKGGTALGTFNILVGEAVGDPIPVWRPQHPLRYVNAQGQEVPLANATGIPWAIFSASNGGVISGARLDQGTLSTDASGNFSDIGSESIAVGDEIEIVIRPVGLSLVIAGTVIDGRT